MGANIAILVELLLQLALKAGEYAVLVRKAQSEGRDITKEELDQLAAGAQASLDELQRTINAAKANAT